MDKGIIYDETTDLITKGGHVSTVHDNLTRMIHDFRVDAKNENTDFL